jgi:DNA-directed RNA polymerase specialized sigma24 family protein
MSGEVLLLMVLSAKKLTPMQRDVFIDRHVLGRTMRDCAAEYGVSSQAIAQADRRAKAKMGRVMLEAVAA